MKSKAVFTSPGNGHTPAPVVFIPLNRAVICIDCEAIMTRGRRRCAACGSGALAALEPWLISITKVCAKTEVA